MLSYFRCWHSCWLKTWRRKPCRPWRPLPCCAICIVGFDSCPRELSGSGLDLGVPSRRMEVPSWGCKWHYFAGLLCCCRRYFAGTAMLLLLLLLCCCCCFAESWEREMRETEDGEWEGDGISEMKSEREIELQRDVLLRVTEIKLQRMIAWDRLLIHWFFMFLCNCDAWCCFFVGQRWIGTSTCWTSRTPVLCFTLNFKIWIWMLLKCVMLKCEKYGLYLCEIEV